MPSAMRMRALKGLSLPPDITPSSSSFSKQPSKSFVLWTLPWKQRETTATSTRLRTRLRIIGTHDGGTLPAPKPASTSPFRSRAWSSDESIPSPPPSEAHIIST